VAWHKVKEWTTLVPNKNNKMGSWIIGVCLNLTGSLLINGGTNVMKLAHVRRAQAINSESIARLHQTESQEATAHSEVELTSLNADEDGHKGEVTLHRSPSSLTEAAKQHQPPPVWKSKIWLLGFLLFTVGNVLNFVSFGFAAQSLLAALGAVQFVSNVFFARFLLKEPITWKVVAATIVITVWERYAIGGLCESQVSSVLFAPFLAPIYALLAHTQADNILLESLHHFVNSWRLHVSVLFMERSQI
jgi:hypothetical protein